MQKITQSDTYPTLIQNKIRPDTLNTILVKTFHNNTILGNNCQSFSVPSLQKLQRKTNKTTWKLKRGKNSAMKWWTKSSAATWTVVPPTHCWPKFVPVVNRLFTNMRGVFRGAPRVEILFEHERIPIRCVKRTKIKMLTTRGKTINSLLF